MDDWEDISGLPDKRVKNEIPVSAMGGWWNVPLGPSTTNFTGTDLEALMSSAPGDEPEISDYYDGDPYADLDLDEFEVAVLDAIVVSGLSYRQAARVLGVSHTTVRRVHMSAIERIRRQMGWMSES